MPNYTIRYNLRLNEDMNLKISANSQEAAETMAYDTILEMLASNMLGNDLEVLIEHISSTLEQRSVATSGYVPLVQQHQTENPESTASDNGYTSIASLQSAPAYARLT